MSEGLLRVKIYFLSEPLHENTSGFQEMPENSMSDKSEMADKIQTTRLCSLVERPTSESLHNGQSTRQPHYFNT